jgi:hypothetical protein
LCRSAKNLPEQLGANTQYATGSSGTGGGGLTIEFIDSLVHDPRHQYSTIAKCSQLWATGQSFIFILKLVP